MPNPAPAVDIGVDIGGTFTDIVCRRAGEPIEPAGGELRDYGVGAQMLIDLGVKEMVLLSNSKKSVVGLEGFGLKIVGQKPVPGRAAHR